MLALLIARPSLTACTSFPIAALLVILASFSSEIHAQNSLNGGLPVTEAYPLAEESSAEESSADETSGHASSTAISDCFDIKTPYGLTFADGSELTVEWGLEELQDKMQAGHPGRIPNGFVFPLTIDYIDGTSELISSQETMEARINSCNNE
jgi:hypothetical protein